MSMSKDLFLALLSMDAYNRGYGAGLTLPGDTSLLGNAAVLTDSTKALRDPITNEPLDQPAGFYTVAYKTTKDIGTAETGGIIPAETTIISYRGTDANLVSPFGNEGSDLLNGYGLGTGSPFGPQAFLAVDFYNANPAAHVTPQPPLRPPSRARGEGARRSA